VRLLIVEAHPSSSPGTATRINGMDYIQRKLALFRNEDCSTGIDRSRLFPRWSSERLIEFGNSRTFYGVSMEAAPAVLPFLTRRLAPFSNRSSSISETPSPRTRDLSTKMALVENVGYTALSWPFLYRQNLS